MLFSRNSLTKSAGLLSLASVFIDKKLFASYKLQKIFKKTQTTGRTGFFPVINRGSNINIRESVRTIKSHWFGSSKIPESNLNQNEKTRPIAISRMLRANSDGRTN